MQTVIQGNFSEKELDAIIVYMNKTLNSGFFWVYISPTKKGKDLFEAAKTWHKINEMEFPNCF